MSGRLVMRAGRPRDSARASRDCARSIFLSLSLSWVVASSSPTKRRCSLLAQFSAPLPPGWEAKIKSALGSIMLPARQWPARQTVCSRPAGLQENRPRQCAIVRACRSLPSPLCFDCHPAVISATAWPTSRPSRPRQWPLVWARIKSARFALIWPAACESGQN